MVWTIYDEEVMPSPRKRLRAWPRLSAQERLRRWKERVRKDTLTKFKTPREMFLPARIARELGLDIRVELQSDGRVFQHGCEI